MNDCITEASQTPQVVTPVNRTGTLRGLRAAAVAVAGPSPRTAGVAAEGAAAAAAGRSHVMCAAMRYV